MPNWTFNRITVTGDKEQVAKLLTDAVPNKEGNLDFGSWFPIPETYEKYDTTNHPDGKGLTVGEEWWDGLGRHDGVVTEELIEEFKQATKEQKEKYGAVGWYDYNRKYFGCKWNCEMVVEHKEDGLVEFSCDTPWCAPDAFLLRLSGKYPELTFEVHSEYEEGLWEDTVYQNGDGDQVGAGEMDWDDEEEEAE